jgi:hypothetical protein
MNGVTTETMIAPNQLTAILALDPESPQISAAYRNEIGAIVAANAA